MPNSMLMSAYLAKLMAPVAIAIGVGMLLNPTVYRALAEQFLRSRALIYLSGLLTMTAGVALVLAHNVWAADWRIVITVIGWLAAIGGAFRIIAPHWVETVGGNMLGRRAVLTGGGLVVLALGLILGFFGYLR